jgi:tetratricopeptide (TPR) repeat protein
MSWANAGLEALPFAGRLAKRWWRKRDLARNLSKAVISALRERRGLAAGVREELVFQWLYVRDDPKVTVIVRGLLDDRTAEQEQLLRRRIDELLGDLDLKLGVEKTADQLTKTVLENLAEAQPTADQRYRADMTHLHKKLEASSETQRTILSFLSEAPLPPDWSRRGEGGAGPRSAYQLPRDISDFTNRERERDALLSAFSQAVVGGPVVATVSGKPGVGKSALAIRVAHLIAENYPDAHLYADLGETEAARAPSEVLADFLGALGAQHTPSGQGQREDLYRHMSRGRRLLVVLDNAKCEREVRSLIPAHGKCAVVVTSRSPLAGLEDVALSCSLDVLSLDASREFLVTLLGESARIEQESAAVDAIVALCGRLPLALRIAGARLRARNKWTLTAFADRLAVEHRRLDELTAGDREVRASFDLSYQDLDTGPSRLFRLLGLVRGPTFDASLAAALLGSSVADARARLEDLADAQLVDVVDDERYAFHDLIRIFARERQEAEEEQGAIDDALDALLDFYLSRVVTIVPAIEGAEAEPTESLQDDPFVWLERERLNLLAAIEQAYNDARWFPTWALAMGLSRFYERRGHWEEWRRTHELALDAARRIIVIGDEPDAPDPRLMEAMAASRLGLVYLAERRSDDAIACHEAALAFAAEGSDPSLEISELNNIGNAYVQADRLDDAIEQFARALRLATEADDRAGKAAAHNNLGLAYKDLERLADARSCFDRSFKLKTELGDELGQARTLANLANLAHLERRWEEAERFYGRSVTLFRACSDTHGAAMSEMDLAGVQARRGDWSNARATLERVLATFTEVGDSYRVAWTHIRLSSIAKDHGDEAAAIAHAETSLELFRRLGVPDGETEALNALAVAYMWRGDLPEAIEFYQANLATLRDLGNRSGEAATLGNLATAYAFNGNMDQAATTYEASISLFGELGEPHGEAISRNDYGKLLAALGKHEEADANYEHSLGVFRQVGDRHGEGSTLGNLAELRAAVGDLDGATRLYDMALSIKRELGDQRGVAQLLVSLGHVLEAMGDRTAAIAVWRQGLAIPDGLSPDEADALRLQIWRYTIIRTVEESSSRMRARNPGSVAWRRGFRRSAPLPAPAELSGVASTRMMKVSAPEVGSGSGGRAPSRR